MTKAKALRSNMTNSSPAPFVKDALNRHEYAEGIYKLVQRLDKGVIAIDGEWGVGKSWFGAELKRLIEYKDEFQAIWIDAFEADWDDDPALTLISAFAEDLAKDKREKFFDVVTPLLAKAVPVAAKLAIKAAANVVGIEGHAATAAAEMVKDSGEVLVRKKLDQLAERKKTLEYLKRSISDCVLASKGGKLVVFVDELDRCSPKYAIQMLERLKHLFAIEGVVFVLLWHRLQIKNAVEAFYGAGSNGAMYLDKFVDYPLTLSASGARAGRSPMERLLSSMKESFPEGRRLHLQENIPLLNAVAHLLRLNARQTKRAAEWWVMSTTRNFVSLETWLIGIKARHPIIFDGLKKGEKQAHQAAAALLGEVDPTDNAYKMAQVFVRFHQSYATGVFNEDDEELVRFCAAHGVQLSQSLKIALRHIEETFD